MRGATARMLVPSRKTLCCITWTSAMVPILSGSNLGQSSFLGYQMAGRVGLP